MTRTDTDLDIRDRERVTAAVQENEQIVLVAKPKAQMDVVEKVSRLVPGVFLLGGLAYAVIQMQLWWLAWVLTAPFWVLGVLLLFSPRWHRRRMERTLYVLTDRRVLVLEPCLLFGARTIAYPLCPNPVKEVHEYADGCGDIVFAYEQRWMLSPRQYRGPHPVGFIAVPQVQRVAQMIAEQVAAAAAMPLPPLPAVPPSLAGLPTETDSWGNLKTQNPNRKVMMAFGAAFSLFALVFMGLGIYRLQQEARFEREGVQVTATVVRVVEHYHQNHHTHRSSGSGLKIRVGSNSKKSGSYTYYPVVQFKDALGNTHEYESDTGSSHKYAVGQQMQVRYLPSDPSKVTPADDSSKTGLVFTLVGGLVFVVGLGVFVGGVMMNKK